MNYIYPAFLCLKHIIHIPEPTFISGNYSKGIETIPEKYYTIKSFLESLSIFYNQQERNHQNVCRKPEKPSWSGC